MEAITSRIQGNDRTAIIYTDSRIIIDSLKNTKNHNSLIEEIRKKETSLENNNWIIHFSWVKAHDGLLGNELADRLAKGTATNSSLKKCYDKISKSTILNDLRESAKEIAKEKD